MTIISVAFLVALFVGGPAGVYFWSRAARELLDRRYWHRVKLDAPESDLPPVAPWRFYRNMLLALWRRGLLPRRWRSARLAAAPLSGANS